MADESENGWRPARLAPDSDLLLWKQVPGTNVTIQVMRGFPDAILPAWVADWNAYIEPVRDPDTASYTPTNSVATSNHLNGTAVDINWNDHPFHAKGTLNTEQMRTLREMLAFYEGWVFWAGDWTSPVDEMHSQMGYNTWNHNERGFDFLARKIRPDGFSTFRRGAPDTAPVPPAGDTAAIVLYDAVPVISMERASQLADAMRDGLRAAHCDNPKRIAMFLAQCGHESDGFATTQEYGTGQRYAPYIGRTWIQITWESNYRAFGQWANSQGLLAAPEQFVRDPASLADLHWAGIGAAWYWTVARPDINTLSDAGDIVTVTQRINGGQNGIADRRKRYEQATALGDRLLALVADPVTAPPPADEPTGPLTDAEQRELLAGVRWLREQLGPNLWGPDSSVGVRDDGAELTVRDGIAAIRREVTALLDSTLLTTPTPNLVETPKRGPKQ